MGAYYNEIDPYCAAWLQNLMDAGHIAPGVIDTRSIEDVRPDELSGYTQCHFFAGIGVWSLALRSAGWPDSRRAWTGSCPCQPFSAAGKGAGFADERHLWPAWQHLIAQYRPAVVFGEQVASKDAEPWIDLVHADLEGMGYAFGCVPFPSSGVGAPHIRERAYWVADADGERGAPWIPAAARRHEWDAGITDDRGREYAGATGRPKASGLDNADGGHASAEREQRSGQQRQQPQDGGVVRLADADILAGGQGCAIDGRRDSGSDAKPWSRLGGSGLPHGNERGPTNGFWRDADWLGCTDGKWRPVEPGTFPLAHGASSRVGRLRAYGNAINAQAAQAFIESYCEARGLILVPVEAAA